MPRSKIRLQIGREDRSISSAIWLRFYAAKLTAMPVGRALPLKQRRVSRADGATTAGLSRFYAHLRQNLYVSGARSQTSMVCGGARRGTVRGYAFA
jgi:hypothetical protein